MNEQLAILVTGAAGFVGSTVARLARASGLRLLAHARRPSRDIDFAGDLSDTARLRSLPWDNIGAVIHCAAAIPSRSSFFDRDNTGSAIALADVLMEAKQLRRLIHVSSFAVYRPPELGSWSISEQAAVVGTAEPGPNAYAQSKRKVELALDAVARERPQVSVCHLRASSIYGPGMVETTLLPVLVGRARRNQPIVLRGPRAYRQNFVHVNDVASLAITLATKLDDRFEPVVNAFSDDTYGLFELADLLRAELGSSSPTIDQTQDIKWPTPFFENRLAKRHYPCFSALRDHLQDLPL